MNHRFMANYCSAAGGVWNRPRKCFCQRYDLKSTPLDAGVSIGVCRSASREPEIRIFSQPCEFMIAEHLRITRCRLSTMYLISVYTLLTRLPDYRVSGSAEYGSFMKSEVRRSR